MTKLEFARSLIRAPWAERLQDRTYVNLITQTIVATLGLGAILRQPGVDINVKVGAAVGVFVGWSAVLHGWNKAEKAKDAAIGIAALQSAEGDSRKESSRTRSTDIGGG